MKILCGLTSVDEIPVWKKKSCVDELILCGQPCVGELRLTKFLCGSKILGLGVRIIFFCFFLVLGLQRRVPGPKA